MKRYPPLSKVLSFLLLWSLLILVSIQWLDRPLADWVHASDWRRFVWLERFTHLVDVLVGIALAVLVLTPLRLALRRPPGRVENTLWAMAVSLAVSTVLKDGLKFVFGRAWPETWVNHNPSWIHDHVYGFFWLQSGAGFHAFPSGHTTLAFATMSVLWLTQPRWRWLAAQVCTLVVLGLLGMNYHFLADCIAGAGLGSACGLYVVITWRRAVRGDDEGPDAFPAQSTRTAR